MHPNSWLFHMISMGAFGLASAFSASFLYMTIPCWWSDPLWWQGKTNTLFLSLLAWTSLPYILKGLLSPFVDKIPLHPVFLRFGRRRSWVFVMQTGLVFFSQVFSWIQPQDTTGIRIIVFIACFGFTLCSAFQDIILEAYRIDQTPLPWSHKALSINTLSFRLGTWMMGYIPPVLAHYYGWSFSFHVYSWCIALTMIFSFFICDPQEQPSIPQLYFNILYETYGFFQKNYWIPWVIIMIGSYKLGETFLKSMIMPFLYNQGYNKQEIATIDKGLSAGAMMVGISLSNLIIEKKGMAYGFALWSIVQMITALSLCLASLYHAPSWMLILLITINHGALGLGSYAFFLYLSSLCQTETNATVGYALLTSLGSFGRTLASSLAWAGAMFCSWPVLFLISALVCIPTLWLSSQKKPFMMKNSLKNKFNSD